MTFPPSPPAGLASNRDLRTALSGPGHGRSGGSTGQPAPSWTATPRGRCFVYALYGTIFILLAIPLTTVLVPPLYDYPNHLARMHVLANWAVSPELQTNYVVAWKPAPYLAMDVIVPRLAQFMSIYTAGKVFLYACLAQFVLGTAAVHGALYRRLSPWPAASALFAYSLMFSHGFTNYLFGMGAWLLAFAAWIALSRRGIVWRLIAGSFLSLVVFFTHYFAFFGYMLCVGAYELGLWLIAPGRNLMALTGRGAIAFCPFVLPLVLFLGAEHGQDGGVIWYGTPLVKLTALFSPVLFPTALFSFTLLAVLVVIPLRRGLLGRLDMAPEMRLPLLAIGAVTAAMPNVLSGVWDVDCRLPVMIVFLAIAGTTWRNVPVRAGLVAASCGMALLTANIGLIVLGWQPVARQYDAYRSALDLIPRGAKIIAFRDDFDIDPARRPGPETAYSHLPALAVIDRDVFLPFLFKNPMMPVQSAPGLQFIDSATGEPIEVSELIEGADPVKGPLSLGRVNSLGVRNYWGGWPKNFDYAIELSFGAHPALPPALNLVSAGGFFNIYRIEK